MTIWLCFSTKLMHFLSKNRHALWSDEVCVHPFLRYPVYNSYKIQSMWRNQQDEPVFKSTENCWINMWLEILTVLIFNQRIDMGNQKNNFIGCKGPWRYSGSMLCPHGRYISCLEVPAACLKVIRASLAVFSRPRCRATGLSRMAADQFRMDKFHVVKYKV